MSLLDSSDWTDKIRGRAELREKHRRAGKKLAARASSDHFQRWDQGWTRGRTQRLVDSMTENLPEGYENPILGKTT